MVVKIGGSWITNPKLTSISRLEDKEDTIIVVAGGGYFADSINSHTENLNDRKTANILAKINWFFII